MNKNSYDNSDKSGGCFHGNINYDFLFSKYSTISFLCYPGYSDLLIILAEYQSSR